MKNIIQINLGTDHTLECTDKVIGRSGEGLVSRLEITVPEPLSEYDAYIDFEKPNGETLRTPRLEVESNVAYYDVPQYLLIENGEIKVQLVFEKSGGKVWKSSKKRYTILKSVNAVDDIPDKEDFISEAQKLINELNQEVEEIAVALSNKEEFAQSVIDACGGQTKITTINGIALKFFVGTQAEYEALNDGQKQNLFAIITDDTTKERIESKLALKGGIEKNDFEFINENGGWTIPEGYDPCGNYYSYETVTIPISNGTTETIKGWILRGFHIVDDNYLQVLFTDNKMFIRTGGKLDGVTRQFTDFMQIAGTGTMVSMAETALGALQAVQAETAQTAQTAETAKKAQKADLLASGGWIELEEWLNKGSVTHFQQSLEHGAVYLVCWGERQSEELKTGIATMLSGYAKISDVEMRTINGVSEINRYEINLYADYIELNPNSEIDYITGVCAKRIA